MFHRNVKIVGDEGLELRVAEINECLLGLGSDFPIWRKGSNIGAAQGCDDSQGRTITSRDGVKRPMMLGGQFV